MNETIAYPIDGTGYTLRQPPTKDGRIFKLVNTYENKDGELVDLWDDGRGCWFEILPLQNGVAEVMKNTEEAIMQPIINRFGVKQ